MNKVIRVCIKSDCEMDLDLDLLSFGISVAKMIRAGGGLCVPLWLDHSLVLIIQNATSNEVESLLGPFIECAQRHRHQIDIIHKDAADFEGESLSQNYTGPGAYRWQRLTKTFFNELGAGAHVRSTMLNDDGTSKFDIYTCEPENLRQRAEQWQLAKEAGAKDRNCIVIF